MKKESVLFCIFVLIFLGINLDSNWIVALDQSVYQFLMLFKSPIMTMFMTLITHMGSGYFFFCVCLLCLFLKVKDVWHISANVSLSAIINTSVKNIIRRTRPSVDKLTHATGYSFPSGHTSASMAFYSYAYKLIKESSLSDQQKGIGCSLMIFLIIMIGISRIYLGAHFFSDVLAGWAAGYLYMNIYCFIKNRWMK